MILLVPAILLLRVAAAFKVTTVSAGGDHSLILLENGEVFAAGDNRHGQLGIGHKKDVNAAVRVGISAKVKAVAAGCTHSLMITESGDVYAAGDNNHGQLGTGGTQGFSVPVKMDLDAGSKAISAAAGCWFSLLLLESGAVYGVGLNSFGQLGVGSIVYPADHTRPVKMQLAGRARSIAAGCTHSLVLLENGDAYATGDNLDGQLGIGNTQDQARPKKVLAPSNVVAIAAGTYHSFAAAGHKRSCCCRQQFAWSTWPRVFSESSYARKDASGCSSASAGCWRLSFSCPPGVRRCLLSRRQRLWTVGHWQLGQDAHAKTNGTV